MAWVRLDDGFVDHPKIARVGAIGAWLQVQALCYANRHLTDGFIPQSVAESLARRGLLYVDEHDRRWTVAQTSGLSGRDADEMDWPAIMVHAELWEVVPGGYRIHDYREYQPTRAEVLARRRATVTRVQRYRAKSQAPDSPKKSSRNAVSNASPGPGPGPLVDPKVVGLLPRTDARAPTNPWPNTLTLTAERRAVATLAGLDPATEWNAFRDYNRAKGTRFASWDDAWRLWVRRAPAFHRAGRG